MLKRLYNILNMHYKAKIMFACPLVVDGSPAQIIHSITKLPCGYSVLVEVAGHKDVVHINKLSPAAVEALVEHLTPVNLRIVDKVHDAWVNVYSQKFLS